MNLIKIIIGLLLITSLGGCGVKGPLIDVYKMKII
tara:strand:+ start:439 stop:543 length:105 start_codon:yes stop_codon:yes gene_type:complete